MRGNLNGGMNATGRCAANHERDLAAAEVLVTLHLACDIRHFFKARCNESRQTNHIGFLGLGTCQNFGSRDHDTHVDDFKVIALKHNRDNILTDIVHIAFDGRDHDLAFSADIAPSRGN